MHDFSDKLSNVICFKLIKCFSSLIQMHRNMRLYYHYKHVINISTRLSCSHLIKSGHYCSFQIILSQQTWPVHGQILSVLPNCQTPNGFQTIRLFYSSDKSWLLLSTEQAHEHFHQRMRNIGLIKPYVWCARSKCIAHHSIGWIYTLQLHYIYWDM